MNKQKSYHHPPKNPNFFWDMKLFFSVQLGHLKLSGYGLLSTQGVQNRSQNCRSISQSDIMLQYMRDPGAPAELRPKGVKRFCLSPCCLGGAYAPPNLGCYRQYRITKHNMNPYFL